MYYKISFRVNAKNYNAFIQAISPKEAIKFACKELGFPDNLEAKFTIYRAKDRKIMYITIGDPSKVKSIDPPKVDDLEQVYRTLAQTVRTDEPVVSFTENPPNNWEWIERNGRWGCQDPGCTMCNGRV